MVTDRVRAALIEHATPIVGLGAQLAQQAGVRFAGIDLSPAPAGQDSIAAAIEAASGQPLGAPGTLALAAALTAALKTTPLLLLAVADQLRRLRQADRWPDADHAGIGITATQARAVRPRQLLLAPADYERGPPGRP